LEEVTTVPCITLWKRRVVVFIFEGRCSSKNCIILSRTRRDQTKQSREIGARRREKEKERERIIITVSTVSSLSCIRICITVTN